MVTAAGLVATGCTSSGGKQAGPPTTVPPVGSPSVSNPLVAAGERRPERVSFLVQSTSCERFADAVRPVALEAVGPYGFSGGTSSMARDSMATESGRATTGAAAPSAAPGAQQKIGGGASDSAQAFSSTNVQEAGVDEPDSVKTDGKLLVTTLDGRLRVMDVAGAPRLVGTLELPDGGGNLLLVGDRALILSGGNGGLGSQGGGFTSDVVRGAPSGRPDARPGTKVTVVDLKDPAKPTVARTHTIDGSYVDARLVGGVARIVTRSQPDLPFPQPKPAQQDPSGGQEQGKQSAEKATAANAEVVRTASPNAFLPKGASCSDAYVPVEAAGVGTIAVQSLDPAAEKPGPAVTVVADASTVYASAGRLFIATNRYGNGGPVRPAVVRPGQPEPGPEAGRTAIHAFDITDPAKARYAGSGDVPGRLLNQFSLSEHEGVLRVATTIDGSSRGGEPTPLPGIQAPDSPNDPNDPTSRKVQAPPQNQSQSRVSILRQAGEEWVETGAVDGLGKGERIYAVRFLGATGYVVTFRQVDPLYVLDLRDVKAPKVTGELKITGYSAYLHPAGDGRLLGIGQEATDQGLRLGTQLSLFDVKNPAAPTKLAGAVLSQGSSSAEDDHHAFLYWPANGLVVAPVMSHGGVVDSPTAGPGISAPGFIGAVAFKVGDKTVAEAGRITHPGSTPIERSLVVGDRLLTVSRVGVADNNLGTLADGGFLAFR